MISLEELAHYLGTTDIYFLDQLLKGRLSSHMKFLDAGCGGGRNLFYLLQTGITVFGMDRSLEAIQRIQETASHYAPKLPKENFVVGELKQIPFENEFFDFILCNAVLHFAQDEIHFEAMVQELWRVLKPGGIFFARLASTIGIESQVEQIEGRWFHLPDGSDRFLVDETFLLEHSQKLQGEFLDPIKTVNVQGQRCMTNWCLRKK